MFRYSNEIWNLDKKVLILKGKQVWKKILLWKTTVKNSGGWGEGAGVWCQMTLSCQTAYVGIDRVRLKHLLKTSDKLPYVFTKVPDNKVSNYCRAKGLSFLKGKIRQNQEYFRGVVNSAKGTVKNRPTLQDYIFYKDWYCHFTLDYLFGITRLP